MLNFNYTSQSATTGVTTTHSFSGTSGAFLRTPFAGDMIHGGYVFDHNSINLGIGYNYDMNSAGLAAYIKLGYGYIFRFGRLQIQPTADLYVNMDGPAKLGFIDNNGVNLAVLGESIHARFLSTSFDATSFTSQTATINAGNLEIDYNRTSYLAEPKLIIGTFVRKKLYLGIEGGWMLQIAQTSVLKLLQNGDGGSNVAARIPIGEHGSLGGPCVAINIGYRFGGSTVKKKGH
jgi:hypothetical protein